MGHWLICCLTDGSWLRQLEAQAATSANEYGQYHSLLEILAHCWSRGPSLDSQGSARALFLLSRTQLRGTSNQLHARHPVWDLLVPQLRSRLHGPRRVCNSTSAGRQMARTPAEGRLTASVSCAGGFARYKLTRQMPDPAPGKCHLLPVVPTCTH